jgi:methylated-DNA-protein-cysteine methyltransferase-like protein
VTTYGAVAQALGSARVARQVGWAMAACRDDDVPWHRVLGASGAVSSRGDREREELQRTLLASEGIVFGPSGRVDLATYGHAFGPPAEAAATTEDP